MVNKEKLISEGTARKRLLQKIAVSVLPENTKIAEKPKEKSYLKQVATVAPIFGAKAVLGDLPRKTLEGTIHARGAAKAKGLKPPHITSSVSRAFSGRGLGTAAFGGATGIMTAPMFLKGVELAGSEDPKEQVKGVGLIAGSGAVYQGMKGYGEGMGMAKAQKLKSPAVTGAAYSLGRILMKTPAAVAFGLAISAGRKKKDGKDPTFTQKYVKPALMTAAIGGVQNVVNDVLDEGFKASKGMRTKAIYRRLGQPKALKSLLPAGKAGVIGGALGGLITAAVVDKAVAKLKKKQK